MCGNFLDQGSNPWLLHWQADSLLLSHLGSPVLIVIRLLLWDGYHTCMCAKLLQSCPTLCDPMDCSLPGSFVHGIFQARVLEWVAIAFSTLGGYKYEYNTETQALVLMSLSVTVESRCLGHEIKIAL